MPQAAKSVSRFAGDVARAFARYVRSATGRCGKGDRTGTGDAEIPPDFPPTGDGKDRDDSAFDASDFGSMFLAPVLAPRPRPRPRVLRRRLRRLTERFMAALRKGGPAGPSMSGSSERQSQFMRPPPPRRRDDKVRYDFNHPKPPWMR